MTIYLKKFGTLLFSRESGREAFIAVQTQLADITDEEIIEIDFEGVVTFSSSWGDEFLTPLVKKYGNRIFLINTKNNPSTKVTLELLKDINKTPFQIKS